MNVGFIGLGHMGSGMAANLVKAGHTVTVYNRTQERTEPLVALGAKAAINLAEACKGDAVFTMLANDDAVKGVVYGDMACSHIFPGLQTISRQARSALAYRSDLRLIMPVPASASSPRLFSDVQMWLLRANSMSSPLVSPMLSLLREISSTRSAKGPSTFPKRPRPPISLS